LPESGALDDPPDRLRHEVLPIGTQRVEVGLLIEEGHPRIRSDIDDGALDIGTTGEFGQFGAEFGPRRTGSRPGQAIEVGQDQGAVPTGGRSMRGGRKRLSRAIDRNRRQSRADPREEEDAHMERLSHVHSLATTHPNVEFGVFVPGVGDDPFGQGPIERRDRDHTAGLRAGVGFFAELSGGKLGGGKLRRRELGGGKLRR
jgi:hypothetical protein